MCIKALCVCSCLEAACGTSHSVLLQAKRSEQQIRDSLQLYCGFIALNMLLMQLRKI